MDGTATAGTSYLYAREGHTHPTDTARAADSNTAHLSGAETITGAKTLTAALNTSSYVSVSNGIQQVLLGTAGVVSVTGNSAASAVAFQTWGSGDLDYRFAIDNSGGLQWGSGGSSFDVGLTRSAATLRARWNQCRCSRNG